MKVFDAETLRKIDLYTIENEPIKSVDLMERASCLVVKEIMSRWDRSTPMVVFAGSGNNGGDALAVARLLLEQNYNVSTYLFNPSNRLTPECDINRERLRLLAPDSLIEVVKEFVPMQLTSEKVVIDGMFGTGLNRPISGAYSSVVQYINDGESTIVSIDLPSGLFVEDNSTNDPKSIISADLTLTFQFPKLAFFFADNHRYVGEWKVLDIGLDKQIVKETASKVHYITESEVVMLLKPRSKFSHKGNYGKVLVGAGSRGMIGASLLSAKASLRSGAGLVTIRTPRCGYTVLQSALPEAMVSCDDHTDHITLFPEVNDFTASLFGPGLGLAADTAEALLSAIRMLRLPAVFDADALTILSRHRDSLSDLPPLSILTPHPKELERLCGAADSAYERMVAACSLARHLNVVVVLKGAHTMVVSPSGDCYVNSTGNPGMATAGSGDVLSGIIVSLLAQGYRSVEAAILGVYIHGLAGDIAAVRASQQSLIASDIIDNIGSAYALLQQKR